MQQLCEDLTGLQLPQAGYGELQMDVVVLAQKTEFGNLVGVLKKNSPVMDFTFKGSSERPAQPPTWGKQLLIPTSPSSTLPYW